MIEIKSFKLALWMEAKLNVNGITKAKGLLDDSQISRHVRDKGKIFFSFFCE